MDGSYVNYSAIHFDTARLAMERSAGGADVTIVFSVMALEALVMEQALVARLNGDATAAGVEDADWTRGGVERIQALLALAFKVTLDTSRRPSQDLTHLIRLRNGLVHFRFNEVDSPLRRTLRELAKRDYFADADAQSWAMGWPNYAKPTAATWAIETVSGIANEIANMTPHAAEEEVIRNNFAP